MGMDPNFHYITTSVLIRNHWLVEWHASVGSMSRMKKRPLLGLVKLRFIAIFKLVGESIHTIKNVIKLKVKTI